MIIEFFDIAERHEAMAHTIPPPEGCTLGTIMRHDAKVALLIPYISRASANGMTLADWENYQPLGNDRIRFEIRPGAEGGLATLSTALYYAYIVVQVALVVYSIVSLFMKPKTPKQQGDSRQSSTYSFEGLRDTIAPGFPIKLTYGKHREGGQLLMYYLSMLPDNSGLAMNMLLSMGEGPVFTIGDVELNEIDVTMLESVTIETRLGYSSQSIIEGFETIKNTYYDGREISDERELVKSLTSCSQIIYRTSGFDVLAVEHFVNAPTGITNFGLTSGEHHGAWVDYTVEYRDAQNAVCDNPAWSDFEVHRINGRDARMEWNTGITNFPYASRWDVRFTWVNANRHPARNPDRMNAQVNVRIYLQDVTEIRGPSGPFSNEALLSIRAAPNRDLHGGRPNATAVVRGLLVKEYASPTDEGGNTIWTQNPAWPILNYMTNSRYGMGAYVQTSDIDLQSFIDFATLADSLTDMCPDTNPFTSTNIGRCFGTPDFHHGDPPQASGGMDSDTDVYECGEYNSRYDAINQHGFCRLRMCCDPSAGAPSIWGVFSGEYLCEWQDSWLWLTRVTTGTPIFGIIGYMTPDSSPETCTAYGLLCDPASSLITITRWNNQSINTYGTILQTHSVAYQTGDYFDFTPNPDYDIFPNNPESRGVNLRYHVYTSDSILKLFQDVTDTSPSRVDARTVAIAGLSGVVVLPEPNDRAGDFHTVIVEDFGHSCGLCYDGVPIDVRTFDYTCGVLPPAASKKQFTFAHKVA